MTDVTIKHPLYEKRAPQWVRQRHGVEGEDKIKEEGVIYLPKLEGQRSSYIAGGDTADVGKGLSYEAYKKRASFLNATGRTVEGLVGAIERKEPDLAWPKSRVKYLEHIGSDGDPLAGLIDEALEEVIGIGRYGQLVDAPASDPFGAVSTSNPNPEPYVATYFAENITDWDEDVINGRKTITRVNLQETENVVNEKGEWKPRTQYRVLHLGKPMPETDEEKKLEQDEGYEAFLALWGLVPSDFDDGLVYFQEIWIEAEGERKTVKGFVRDQVIVPRIWGGALMRYIPFEFFNPGGTKPRPEKPLLMDLLLVNLSHYRNSADYEHGLHFTALPQPWVAGAKFQGELWIGSAVAWEMENPQARAGMLEFSGQGLGTLREAMEDKKKQMSMLGARLLEEQVKGVEAADTVRLRHSGEKSVLGRVAMNVSAGLTQVLRWCGMWMGMAEEDVEKNVGLELSSDFDLMAVPPQMLASLIQAVQGGTMSWQNMFWILKRGEMYPDDIDEETEAARILEGAPGLPKMEAEEEDEDEGDDDKKNNDEEEDDE